MNNNNKLLIIIFGGILTLLSLLIGIIIIFSSSFGGTVAVIPIQGEIGYGSSDIVSGSVVSPKIIKKQLQEAKKITL